MAVYHDVEKALTCWHRNFVRTQYGIQGWKTAKIYLDFIVSVQLHGEGSRSVVLDTQSNYLDNLDTADKREVLSSLSDHFQ